MSQTTKRAIAASLKKLLETTPLSKITIADIAEDCGISRMTFYYHYYNKFGQESRTASPAFPPSRA